MKPWSLTPERKSYEVLRAANDAAEAMLAAADDLPGVEDMILFDLQTDVATRFVAFPVPGHVHGQGCGRA